MESLLWAIDLCAVVYLCLWALRTDKARTRAAELAEAEKRRQAQDVQTRAAHTAALNKERGHA